MQRKPRSMAADRTPSRSRRLRSGGLKRQIVMERSHTEAPRRRMAVVRLPGVPRRHRSSAVRATSLDQGSAAAFDPLLTSAQEGSFPSFHRLMNQIPPPIISAPLHYHGSGFTTGDGSQITGEACCHTARRSRAAEPSSLTPNLVRMLGLQRPPCHAIIIKPGMRLMIDDKIIKASAHLCGCHTNRAAWLLMS